MILVRRRLLIRDMRPEDYRRAAW